MRETLSIYNNNPGNLRPSKGMTYEGQIGVDDRGFAVFETPDYGRKALIGDIQAKMSQGRNTPESFIDKYAPGGKDQYGDENTEEQRDNYKIWLAHKLGLKSTGEAFPENSAEKLADAIAAFEGGSWQKKEEEAKQTDGLDEEKTLGSSVSDLTKKTSDEPSNTKEQLKEVLATGAGALTGLNVSSKIVAATKAAEAASRVLNQFGAGAPPQAESRIGLQSWLNKMLAQEGRAVNLPLKELERITGRQIRTMGELGEAYKLIAGTEAQTVSKPMVKMTDRPGVFETTNRITSRTVPGKPGVDLSPYVMKNQSPLAQSVQRGLTTAKDIAHAAFPSAARILGGVAGGAALGHSLYEAEQIRKKIMEEKLAASDLQDNVKKSRGGYSENELRLIAKLAQAGGGGLAMIPTPMTQIGGLGLVGLGSIPDVYDWLQERKRRTANEPRGGLESVDPMGNPLGVAP